MAAPAAAAVAAAIPAAAPAAAAAASAGPAAAPPPAGVVAFDRAEWERQLKVGDLLDGEFTASSLSPEGWFVCQVIEATPDEVRVRSLFWGRVSVNLIRRSHEALQPLASRTLDKYTGPPERHAAVLSALTLPQLTPIPLHAHHLQRFRFDSYWRCDRCQSEFYGKSKAPSYSCLPCCLDLCVNCFIAHGGVDTHPLTCEAPPAERIQLKDYQSLKFVDAAASEYECAICLSVAYNAITLNACGHLFCSACIRKVHPKACPTCREDFTSDPLLASVFVQRQISRLRVDCLHRGCEQKGVLGLEEKGLTDHLMVCAERRFACPRCARRIRVVDAQKHADEECKVRSKPPAEPASKKRPRDW